MLSVVSRCIDWVKHFVTNLQLFVSNWRRAQLIMTDRFIRLMRVYERTVTSLGGVMKLFNPQSTTAIHGA